MNYVSWPEEEFRSGFRVEETQGGDVLYFDARELVLAIRELHLEQARRELGVLVHLRGSHILDNLHDLQDQPRSRHLKFALGFGGKHRGPDFPEIRLEEDGKVG